MSAIGGACGLGFGAEAGGWRGGRLIAVTSLADKGAGTLRACAEATGPRVCIFRVAGTITLSRPIMLRSNVYVAGQTAPGGGIEALTDEPTLTAALNWYRANLAPGGEGLDCPVIEVPTTLVWGTRDAIAGAAQAKGTAHYLRADYRLSEVPDGDHWLPLRAPAALASEIALRTLRN